jgi:hypothetical protein
LLLSTRSGPTESDASPETVQKYIQRRRPRAGSDFKSALAFFRLAPLIPEQALDVHTAASLVTASSWMMLTP